MNFKKVQIRNGFSDRNGIQVVNTAIQYEALDERSRIAIYNSINKVYHQVFSKDYYGETKKNDFWQNIVSEVYLQPLDHNVNYNEQAMFQIVQKTITEGSYDEVLALSEFMFGLFMSVGRFDKTKIRKSLNDVLIKECVGYRLVDGSIVKITDRIEIEAIEKASENPHLKVQDHFDKALHFLANRNKPDFANSIKESISAVEAMCSIINGKNSSLGEALNTIEKSGTQIHVALKSAFAKLFGYTSDAAGIRHSGNLDGPNASFSEAKFMLVTCSAFVNYLMDLKSEKSNNSI